MLDEFKLISHYVTQFLPEKLIREQQGNEFQMPKSHHPLPRISHLDTEGMITNIHAFSN